MEKLAKKSLSFPKINKKIKDFVSNEDWNLSTKSAVIVWAVWVATLGIGEVLAECTLGNQWHYNGTTNGHYNWSGTFWATAVRWTPTSCVWIGVNYNYDVSCTIECSNIDWIVNWHYNITPSCTIWTVTKHCNHISSWDSWGDDGGWDDGGGDDSCG